MGWLGVKKCQLCLQRKVTLASSSGSLGLIVCEGWLIVYQDGDYLYLQSDHLLIADYDDTALRAGTLTCTFLGSRSIYYQSYMGGFHLVDFIITELKNYMIC